MTTFEDWDRRAGDRLAQAERDLALVARDVQALDRLVQAFAPTSAQVAGLQADMDELKRDTHDIGERITSHVTGLHRAVERLRVDMNGRVRALEVWRGTVEGISRVVRWGVTGTATFTGAVISGVAVYLLTH